MAITPLFPEPMAKRPLSQGVQGIRQAIHPLLSIPVQNSLRSQFSIIDWLLIGSGLQIFIIFISPFPLLYSLAPTLALVAFKVFKIFAITLGVFTNPHMENVRVGRQTAIFPNSEGGFDRKKGEMVGGSGMCIILLSVKCNHPLGMKYPPYVSLAKYGKKMFIDLEKNAAEYGFLGFSQYLSKDVLTKPTELNVMYFRSLEDLHKWANTSKSHREGWDWWNATVKELDNITIAHEVYSVPAGNFENIYHNSKPFDFGATSHAIKTAGGEQHFVCPLVDANKGFRSSAARMGTVKS